MDKFTDIAQNAWGAVLAGVRKLREEGKTLDEIAGILQLKNRALVSEWLSGNREAVNAPFPNMLRYLNALNLNIADFIPDTAPTIRRVGAHAPVEVITGDNLKTIQVYASAGAGTGIAVTDLQPMFSVTAPPDYLYRCNFAVMVDGHSMEPTIPHKAVVGVLEVAEFRANELYVACIPYEGLVVKRVAVDRERGEFVFKSDNADKEAYPDFRESIEASEKIIQGRVVWIMCGY